MVFIYPCILVLWMKVASALERLNEFGYPACLYAYMFLKVMLPQTHRWDCGIGRSNISRCVSSFMVHKLIIPAVKIFLVISFLVLIVCEKLPEKIAKRMLIVHVQNVNLNAIISGKI